MSSICNQPPGLLSIMPSGFELPSFTFSVKYIQNFLVYKFYKQTKLQHTDTTHLQVEAVVLHHSLCERWDVDSSITLSSQKELILGELRKEPEELLQSQVVVHGHLQTEQT